MTSHQGTNLHKELSWQVLNKLTTHLCVRHAAQVSSMHCLHSTVLLLDLPNTGHVLLEVEVVLVVSHPDGKHLTSFDGDLTLSLPSVTHLYSSRPSICCTALFMLSRSQIFKVFRSIPRGIVEVPPSPAR